MSRARPGKSLESLVSSIERVLAGNDKVAVESPKLVPDRVTGQLREHDVLITLTGSHHVLTIAAECRDRSRKVTVNDIESFWSKCQDTAIDQGIMVSPKGFSKAALAKAQHRGIRCLRLADASSFNWLLATGITIRYRKMLHANWTFFPEKDIVPKPPAFTILSADGESIPSNNLLAATYQEFQNIPGSEFAIGCGTKSIVFTSPGLLLRDDSSGDVYPVVRAKAVVDYEVVDEVVPFNLVTYEHSPSGEVITDAAVAEVDLGSFKGKLMVVFKENEGGNVVFVPDKPSTT